MSGPYQHHLPVFLQKGFAIPKTGAKKIWKWERGGDIPTDEIIKKTGAEDWFYSGPALDGEITLDDRITDFENPFSQKFSDLKKLPVGSEVEASFAAQVILHLSSRSAHFRETMQAGVSMLTQRVSTVFTNPEVLMNLLGLDNQEPTDKFSELVRDQLIKTLSTAQSNMPIEVMERVAFSFAREQFATLADESVTAVRLFSDQLDVAGPSLVKDGHNKALDRFIADQGNPRQALLAEMAWSVRMAPKEGAILPDCVVLSFSEDGRSGPYMHFDSEKEVAVIMPISSAKLLIGVKKGEEDPDLSKYNEAAASSSHAYFLSANIDPTISALQSVIGVQAIHGIEAAVEEVFEEYVASSSHEEIDGPAQSGDELPQPLVTQFGYQVSFHDFGDKEHADRAASAIRAIVEPLSDILPLHRLDGITFAVNYSDALNYVETGFAGRNHTETIHVDGTKGVAKTVNVLREGVRKIRIVFDAMVLDHLLDHAPENAEWAIRVIVNQLVEVAMVEWIEIALPGQQLRPIDGPLNGWLYQNVNAAIYTYVSSYLSAGFGDPAEVADSSRELFIGALERIKSIILPARLAYRYDADLDRLLGITMPVIQQTLMFAADLLGHCTASGQSVMDDGGALEEALENAGFSNWLPIFHKDLETFRNKLSKWQSFDEFLSFNRHVERLLLQVGMLVWENGEEIRVEIPVGTDAEALRGHVPNSSG